MSSAVLETGIPELGTNKKSAVEEQVVIFNLGNELFAIDIARVQEIVHWQTVTKVPKAPPAVEGVLNLRGKVIPVVDLRDCFGLDSVTKGRETRIVVVEIAGLVVGLTVDGVSEVIHLQSAAIESPSPVVMSMDSTYLRGIAQVGEKLIMLLDLEKVVSMDTLKSLDTMLVDEAV